MVSDDALDDRQPDAGPFELLLPVQALEYAKDSLRVFHVKSDTVVLHKIDGNVALLLAADTNHRRVPAPRELERIRNEIKQNLRQEAGVGVGFRKFGDSGVDPPALLLGQQFL